MTRPRRRERKRSKISARPRTDVASRGHIGQPASRSMESKAFNSRGTGAQGGANRHLIKPKL
jgi:hypothetical protein